MKEYLLDVIIADPAGNITAFVLNEDVEKKDYIEIASKIMEIKEHKVEQVGFIHTSPITNEERMDMMGGEFCGNSTRSFGLYLAIKRGIKGNSLVNVDVSGTSDLLCVEVDTELMQAKTSIPLPQEITYITVKGLMFPMVVFEGIIHIIAIDKATDAELFNAIKQIIYSQYNVEAFGVMFLDTKKEYITPVVSVKNMDTDIYESSCGSGSVATAFFLAHKRADGQYSYNVSQPGGVIEVAVEIRSGGLVNATIGGKIGISKPLKIKI